MATDDADPTRLADLEARFAFLDDQLQQLDRVVAQQRDALDALRQELTTVRETLEALQFDGPDGNPEPPPPHY